MSGIAGVLHLDGKPADAAELQRMLAAIAHRGPDGSAVWRSRNAGLAHATLRALPEASGEQMPLIRDELAITADVRLDNRDELLEALRPVGRTVSDAELILLAYRAWNEDCATRLLGDFAFALWDDRRSVLFCARDHFGTKPFYYHAAGGRFAFASEIKGLFALPDMPRRVNDRAVADYLVSIVPDTQTTLYTGISRLPPHHCLTVGREDIRVRSYWELRPARIDGIDAPERFRELFTASVRNRMRSAGPVGAMLSGGLDSSAIACVAGPIIGRRSKQRLPTFSLVFDNSPVRSERPFIDAVLAQGWFDPVFIESDGYAPFDGFERILAEQEGVFLAPGLAGTRRLYRAAAAKGVNVLLNGHGGDEVVSHGYGRLHELARGNHWLGLWRQARGLAALYDETTWGIFAAYVNRYGPGRQIRSRARAVARRALGHLRGAGRQVLAGPAWRRFVNPSLIERTDLADRWTDHQRSWTAAMLEERTRQAWTLSSGLQAHAFEVLDRAAAAAGVEPRYPFWDKRLVEFCLALPGEEKLDDGWPRLVLRRAMEGILPAEVQWRRDKLDFVPHIVRGMLAHHRDLIEEVLIRDMDGVGAYADLPAVAEAYGRIVENSVRAAGSDVQAVWRTVALSLWLHQLGRPTEATVAAA